jgi:DNA repair protein RadC
LQVLSIRNDEGKARRSYFNGDKWVGYEQRIRLVRSASGLYEPYEVRSAGDVYRAFACLAECDRERLYAVHLDGQCHVCGVELISQGTINNTLISPREVYKSALLANAAGVIVTHNHPSGDPTPSADDRAITRQLVEAGRLLDIPLYDHVVVGHGRYVSFAEAGLL